MSALWDGLRESELQWLPSLGIGWFPVTAQPYDNAYWRRYRGYDKTETGDVLTTMRIDLVARFWDGAVVDIGIGGGRFVSERPNTCGFDVNPSAIDWLKTKGAWFDPYPDAVEEVDAVCFWDSLEHIADPGPLLWNVRKFVFVSCPIYDGPDHVLRSKHFRPTEHFWYWTHGGLVRFMAGFGFELLYHDSRERSAGREDIESAVFKRVRS